MIKYRKICQNCPPRSADIPYVETPPVADFTYVEDELEVTFTDTSTNSPTSWLWDFGDGNTSTLQNPVHTYATDGSYTVTLTATNGDGSDDYSELIDVEEAPAGLAPVGNFSYVEDGLEVTFTDLSTNSPTSWFWEFGVAGTSTLQNPVFTFPSAGSYDVVLVASNAFGDGDWMETINVSEANAVNNTVPTINAQPQPNTALDVTAGSWTGATSVTAQAQRSDTGVGGWADIGSSWVVGVGTPYTPTYADDGKYFRIKETALPGSVEAFSTASLITTTLNMTFQVTTTGASQTLTINELRTVIGQAVNVNWGDSSSNNYTSTGTTGNNRTHLYAAAGTYTVTIDLPKRITHFDIRDTKVSSLTGVQLSKFRELLNLRILTVPDLALNWTVSTTHPMPPLIQYLQVEIQTNLVWAVSTTNPMPPINDVLNLRQLPNLTWTINPTTPLPPLVESLTIRDSAGVDYTSSAESCLDLSVVRIESGWDTTMLDAFLRDLYIAFPSRTVSAGTVDLAGGSPANGVPSGVLAAMCPPTTGKARAYELVNDSCGVSANHWTSVTTA
jgi:PKD repeat protein